jgi:hypothetical protein
MRSGYPVNAQTGADTFISSRQNRSILFHIISCVLNLYERLVKASVNRRVTFCFQALDILPPAKALILTHIVGKAFARRLSQTEVE